MNTSSALASSDNSLLPVVDVSAAMAWGTSRASSSSVISDNSSNTSTSFNEEKRPILHPAVTPSATTLLRAQAQEGRTPDVLDSSESGSPEALADELIRAYLCASASGTQHAPNVVPFVSESSPDSRRINASDESVSVIVEKPPRLQPADPPLLRNQTTCAVLRPAPSPFLLLRLPQETLVPRPAVIRAHAHGNMTWAGLPLALPATRRSAKATGARLGLHHSKCALQALGAARLPTRPLRLLHFEPRRCDANQENRKSDVVVFPLSPSSQLPPQFLKPPICLLPGRGQSLLARQEAELQQWMTPAPLVRATDSDKQQPVVGHVQSSGSEDKSFELLSQQAGFEQHQQTPHVSHTLATRKTAEAGTNTSVERILAPPAVKHETLSPSAAVAPCGLPLSLLVPPTQLPTSHKARQFLCIMDIHHGAGELVVPAHGIREQFCTVGGGLEPDISAAGAPRHEARPNRLFVPTAPPLPQQQHQQQHQQQQQQQQQQQHQQQGPRQSAARQYSSPSPHGAPPRVLQFNADTAVAVTHGSPPTAWESLHRKRDDSFAHLDSSDYHQRLRARLDAITAQLSVVENAACAIELAYS